MQLFLMPKIRPVAASVRRTMEAEAAYGWMQSNEPAAFHALRTLKQLNRAEVLAVSSCLLQVTSVLCLCCSQKTKASKRERENENYCHWYN